MANRGMNRIAVNLRGVAHRFFSTRRGPSKEYQQGMMGWTGGIYEVDLRPENILPYENLARFAVDQYNKRQKQRQYPVLEFRKVVSVKSQTVGGDMDYITLEAGPPGGSNSLYEATVWSQPWRNFQRLMEFKFPGGRGKKGARNFYPNFYPNF